MKTLNMFEDIIKSAKEQVTDRLSSPLFGSFLVSWCLWNYKFIVILFSDATVLRTFQLIETIAFPTIWSIFLNGILFPALTVMAYIFVYPYPAKLVYAFTRRRQKDIIEIRRLIENETPLTIEDSRIIRAQVLEADLRHKNETDNLNTELTITKNLLEKSLQSNVNSSASLDETKTSILEPSQLKIMQRLAERGGNALYRSLISQNGQTQVQNEYDLGELERNGFLVKNYDAEYEDKRYEFTHEGRRALLIAEQNENPTQ